MKKLQSKADSERKRKEKHDKKLERKELKSSAGVEDDQRSQVCCQMVPCCSFGHLATFLLALPVFIDRDWYDLLPSRAGESCSSQSKVGACYSSQVLVFDRSGTSKVQPPRPTESQVTP